MKKYGLILSFMTIWLLGFSVSAFSQKGYALSGSQLMKVSGTSTLHDWDMIAKENIQGTASLEIYNGKLSDVKSIYIEFPVKSLTSGKGSMDIKAYAALHEKIFPAIKFEMTELLGITGNKISAKGRLTVAGNSQIIPLEVTYSIIGKSIQFTGTHSTSFKDYQMEPPTAVFGTIKTGNELTLLFDTNFSPIN